MTCYVTADDLKCFADIVEWGFYEARTHTRVGIWFLFFSFLLLAMCLLTAADNLNSFPQILGGGGQHVVARGFRDA